MKLPRDLSGDRLIANLCARYGYRVVHQVGSHVILETESPRHHRLAVPRHAVLRIGTLNAILRAVSETRGISKHAVAQDLF